VRGSRGGCPGRCRSRTVAFAVVATYRPAEAADELALEVGDLAVGVLKATSVIIEVLPAI